MHTPYLDIREAHYKKHLGALDQKILHSTDVKAVHIDIYQFKPTSEKPIWTIITGGMSDFAQLTPQGEDDYRAPRAEILMYATEPENWMFSVLKGLAEMPFDDATHLHWWHTVPNGMPMTAEPSQWTSYFFLPPYIEESGFSEFEVEGEKVDFLWMIPITEKERCYAMEYGSDELEKILEQVDVDVLLDQKRGSLV